MAAETTAETTPSTPAIDSNDVGLFVTNIAVGYVEHSVNEVRAIKRAMSGLATATPSKQLLQNLITIKMLAPVESRGLIIYNIPQAVNFIVMMRKQLVRRYHETRS